MKKLEEYVVSIPDYPEKGIIFRDVTSILEDPEGLQLSIRELQDKLEGMDFNIVIGPESRGFIFGTPVAYAMGKAFVPARKPGKLPRETVSMEYALEYGTGTIELHKESIKPGQKVAIVGPTGAGKTSALRALERLGGLVLDCDAVYHELLRTDEALRGAITDAFGPVFGADGTLDRQKLGTAVFGDPAAMERLNAIIFDRLPRELLRRINDSDAPLIGIDAINLVESGLSRLCRRTVAVLAPAEKRVRRIMARDGIPEDYARLRVQAQKPDDFYRAHCTDVLVNDAAAPDAFETIAYQRLQHIFEEETDHE